MFDPLPYSFKGSRSCIRVELHELDTFRAYLDFLNLGHGYANIDTTFKAIKNKHATHVFFYWQSNRLKYCAPWSAGKGTRTPILFSDLYHPDISDFLSLI